MYAKLAEREDARRAKDFDLADDIMDELTHLGEVLHTRARALTHTHTLTHTHGRAHAFR